MAAPADLVRICNIDLDRDRDQSGPDPISWQRPGPWRTALGCEANGPIPPTPATPALSPCTYPSFPGFGPPVAQSSNSTVWTTGNAVPDPICTMQPMLPAAGGRLAIMTEWLRMRRV